MRNEQLTTDIIAAVESELATAWYAHAATQRRAQRDANADYSAPDDMPSLVEIVVAVALWLVLPATLALCVWVLFA